MKRYPNGKNLCKVVNSTRRSNGEGSIYQRPDGYWVATFYIGSKENRKRKTVYGHSKTEAVQKMTEVTHRTPTEGIETVENNNLGELMKEFMLYYKKPNLTPRTFEHQYLNFKLHILNKIGNLKLYEIRPLTIQKLLNDMLDDGYSLSTTRKIKFLLNQFFKYAKSQNLVNDNPVSQTMVKSKDRKIYDSENMYKAIPIKIRDEFIKALDHHEFLKPLCFTMMFGGLRIGEALALRWEDVNFETKELKITKAITYVPKFDKEGNVLSTTTVISDTKTSCSVREIPIPEILIDALKEYKNMRYFVGLNNKVNLIADDAIIFSCDDGRVRNYSGCKSILNRFLKSHHLDKYGIHFHTLRHTYSNILFEANKNPKVIQALLGHKSVATTIKTYNSVDKSYFKQATDVLNANFTNEKIKERIESEKEHKYDIKGMNDEEMRNLLIELLQERENRKEKEDANIDT